MSTMKFLTAAGLLAAAGSLVVLPSASASSPAPAGPCQVATSRSAAPDSSAVTTKPGAPSSGAAQSPTDTPEPSCASRPGVDAKKSIAAKTHQVRVRPAGAPETGDGSLAG